eukprot:1160532-Pelagomonas_calceolata.AAC.2
MSFENSSSADSLPKASPALADGTSLEPAAPETGVQPTNMALGARAESARWYNNDAAVSEGEDGPWVSQDAECG